MVVIAHEHEGGTVDAGAVEGVSEAGDEIGDHPGILEGIIARKTRDSIQDVEEPTLACNDVFASHSGHFEPPLAQPVGALS